MSTKLWYNKFVDDWMWALPLGNGRIGAMLYGNPDCEQIEINEESLWSGKQQKEIDFFSKNTVTKKIRQAKERNHCLTNEELLLKYIKYSNNL